jgi:hypothetical protein
MLKLFLHRRLTMLLGLASLMVGTVLLLTAASSDPDESPTTLSQPSRPVPTQVCATPSILDGPAVPPSGAIPVRPGQDLSELTRQHASGTIFWLAPGTHTLADDEYAQVIAKTQNTYIGAPGATLDGRGINRYAFTPGWPHEARDVTIQHLTIRNFRPPPNEGAVNHGAGTGWAIEFNTVAHNGGAGVFLGSGNQLRYNCLDSNGQYGFSGYKPQVPDGSSITGLVVDHNEIKGNNTENWEARIPGCGCTGGGKFWDVRGARITDNWVHDNRGAGLWADTNNIDFLFERNVIENNDGQAIFYEISYNAIIRNNVFRRNALAIGREFQSRRDPFPVGAIYISESGGDPRLPGSPMLEVDHNIFEDNWGGVVLWENSNRFCNSPANTSAGYCTPFTTHSQCVQPKIASEPVYSDCRWKTGSVKVHNNLFAFDRARISCDDEYCGKQGILSNWGTYPEWSPYNRDVISRAITFSQGNKFEENIYEGPWSFTAFDMSRSLSWEAWRADPYGQDGGSRFG